MQIIDGSVNTSKTSYEIEKEVFPMSNINAPRDLERFSYPKNVDVVYYENCREARKKE